MIKIDFKPSKRQDIAFNYLRDNVTTEVLYGGGAGGGKTKLIAVWLILNCIEFPGTRWLLGRAKLKDLKLTTLKTFFETCNQWGIEPGKHFNYNQQKEEITWFNGSEIILKDLFYYPSDPEFTSLGSLEITGAAIDEAADVTEKAVNIVSSRMRFKLTEYNLVPKLFLSCNPSKKWLYLRYYKPFKEGTLKPYQQFVKALITDNPYVSPVYIQQLEKLDRISKERLLFGNWEYEEEDGRLFQYDNIVNCFTNTFVSTGKKYITADIARFGSDKTVILLWSGFRVEKIKVIEKNSIKEAVNIIESLSNDYQVARSNIIIDDDGVGGGVSDYLPGCKRFINNSSTLNNENYENLKSQCYFKFADRVNSNQVFINTDNTQIREWITQELEVQKIKDPDNDRKLGIIPKDYIKVLLGRSTDFSDSLIMREYAELKPSAMYEAFNNINLKLDIIDFDKQLGL